MDPQFLFIIEIALIIIGLAGCIIPGLPGIPLVFSAILVQHFFRIDISYPTWLMLFLTVIVAGVIILQYLIPIWGTKKFGASKWAVRGSIIGLILGVFTSFLGPLGILIGPFAGAFLAELFFAKKKVNDSLRAGFGAFLGILASSAMELVFSVMIAGIYLFYQLA